MRLVIENRIDEMINLIEFLNESLAKKVSNNLNDKTYKMALSRSEYPKR